MTVMDTHESKPYQYGRCPECNEGLVSINSEATNEDCVSDGAGGIIPVGAEFRIEKTCANGHVTIDWDYRSFVPPREREVSVEAEGEPYVGAVVVKYSRHYVTDEASYDSFEDAWETHSWSSGMGQEYTIHYAKPDGTVMWEMPNPFDGWIRRSPDAPLLPEDDDDD